MSPPDSAWRIIGRSVVGSGHERVGLPCQDACAYRLLPSGVVVAAVADGLGSAERSADGAQIAVRVALETLESVLNTDDESAPELLSKAIAAAFAAARSALEQEAEDASVPLRELATTLMVVACGWGHLAAGHLGDGAIVGIWSDQLRTISAPQRGEFANVTLPLTMDEAGSFVVYTSDAEPDALALFSDGLQNLALDARDNAPFKGFFRPLFAGIGRVTETDQTDEQLADFLNSPRINERTDDDKTLVLIGRASDSVAEG